MILPIKNQEEIVMYLVKVARCVKSVVDMVSLYLKLGFYVLYIHSLYLARGQSTKIKKIYIHISERKYKLKTKLYNCTYICIVYYYYLL